MITVYVHELGETRCADRVEERWLDLASHATLWVDFANPPADELRLLSDVFHFHPLAIEDAQSARQIITLKRELATMRRVIVPQRDVIGRLARREFAVISDEMAYRFRDVYDHVVRLTEEALMFQDRVTGILEVNLATVSNRLNQVMKVLTVMSTIFLPLTVLPACGA